MSASANGLNRACTTRRLCRVETHKQARELFAAFATFGVFCVCRRVRLTLIRVVILVLDFQIFDSVDELLVTLTKSSLRLADFVH